MENKKASSNNSNNFRTPRVTIAILGNKKVGKSSLVKVIVEEKFECSTKETFCLNYYDCK